MCKCDPQKRTPYCGKGDCQWPESKNDVRAAMSMTDIKHLESKLPEYKSPPHTEFTYNRNLVMYIFVNKGLHMSAGKVGAQVAQAAIGAYRISEKSKRNDWYLLGGHHTTLIMEARDEQHLMNIQHYLEERGVKSNMMIDEGMTEIPEHTMTTLACEVVDKGDLHVQKTFQSFKLYKDTIRYITEIDL